MFQRIPIKYLHQMSLQQLKTEIKYARTMNVIHVEAYGKGDENIETYILLLLKISKRNVKTIALNYKRRCSS